MRFISLVRLALTLITAGASHAGAQNVLERFYAPELRPIPGDITVNPGFLSTLEFTAPFRTSTAVVRLTSTSA